MIGNILVGLCDFYVMLIFIYILMSWLPTNRGFIADVYQVLGTLCDPYLDIFRRIIPPVGGAGMRVDFSPIVAIFVLQAVVRLLRMFI